MNKNPGRPEKILDWKVLDSILQFGARLIDCSDICELSEDTIQNRIKEKYDITFSDYRKRRMAPMRMKLLQRQYDAAMDPKANNAMLIWLGKQHCGQSENPNAVDAESMINITYSVVNQ